MIERIISMILTEDVLFRVAWFLAGYFLCYYTLNPSRSLSIVYSSHCILMTRIRKCSRNEFSENFFVWLSYELLSDQLSCVLSRTELNIHKYREMILAQSLRSETQSELLLFLESSFKIFNAASKKRFFAFEYMRKFLHKLAKE